jgi:hypothetical protein
MQQTNGIGKKGNGSSRGVEGTCTITYPVMEPGEGITLFETTLELEMPRGVSMPDDLLMVCVRPDGIDRYHGDVKAELDKESGKA